MNFLWLVFASLALIVFVTSGEFVPRRIERSRVRRESVRHVRSPIGPDRTHPHAEAIRTEGGRYVRRADPLGRGLPFGILKKTGTTGPSTGERSAAGTEHAGIGPALGHEAAIGKQMSSTHSRTGGAGAALGKKTPPPTTPAQTVPAETPPPETNTVAETDVQRRRRTVSSPGRRLVSQTPSAKRRPPMRSSAATPSHPVIGQELGKK